MRQDDDVVASLRTADKQLARDGPVSRVERQRLLRGGEAPMPFSRTGRMCSRCPLSLRWRQAQEHERREAVGARRYGPRSGRQNTSRRHEGPPPQAHPHGGRQAHGQGHASELHQLVRNRARCRHLHQQSLRLRGTAEPRSREAQHRRVRPTHGAQRNVPQDESEAPEPLRHGVRGAVQYP